jgi:hypothetical protein
VPGTVLLRAEQRAQQKSDSKRVDPSKMGPISGHFGPDQNLGFYSFVENPTRVNLTPNRDSLTEIGRRFSHLIDHPLESNHRTHRRHSRNHRAAATVCHPERAVGDGRIWDESRLRPARSFTSLRFGQDDRTKVDSGQ